MEINLARFAAILPVNKSVSKIDFIYRVKATMKDDNENILALLYMTPFHRIIKDPTGKLTVL